ncbi:MAG: glucosidase [Acidobacteriota bacterium]
MARRGTGPLTAEHRRLEEERERIKYWSRWGPYLSERAWGTVREDYSANGTAWEYFPHDHARSRVYRWNEDGLAGLSDRHQRICFALALWNERDPFLKERLFGLTGNQGNHGEDVKEQYFYLDCTPTHSYMKWLYKYPQAAFPYEALVEENRRRSREEPEYELTDTGVFDEDRYFDVFVEYAKADAEDILVQITAYNRGPDPAPLHLLPTVWFRNTWAWTHGSARRPSLGAATDMPWAVIAIDEPTYGRRWLYCEGDADLLFTDNETNYRRLFGVDGPRFAKDGINDAVVHGCRRAVNPERRGTKGAAHVRVEIPAGGAARLRLRLTDRDAASLAGAPFGDAFSRTFDLRRREADEFYATLEPASGTDDARQVMRQAFAGLLWSKQFYHYVVQDWIDGDEAQPPPPADRRPRNREWTHLYAADVISMPDKWEYPWYAAWDLAFHCVPLALVDPDFAKAQLILMLREWYMHPNGQMSAYEWAFGDVNPPVHAWAAWRVYKIEKRRRGVGDRVFLQRVFQKLTLNFTWWVNRKDAQGRNVFQGGFLGLDNIGVFDRSAELPTGGHLEQSDGTSWMAMYALNMMAIALELADDNPAYEDMASKFWEHFLNIANAMRRRGGQEDQPLWNEDDGFFYDVLHLPDGRQFPLKVRSMVGLIPLFAVETLEPERLDRLPAFKRRLEWFIAHRRDLNAGVASMDTPGRGARRLMSVIDPDRLRRVLGVMLDEDEFLSPFGIRALSRAHRDRPYILPVNGTSHRVDYEPGESTTGLFGGNSNWRGPIWFPVNFLLIESLQKFHHYLGDGFTVECPTGSGRMLTLWEVAAEISRRLSRLFLRDAEGRRPVNGREPRFDTDPHWRDLVLFHEYFHGDTGAGLGASHQTGWTALVAKLLLQTDGHD